MSCMHLAVPLLLLASQDPGLRSRADAFVQPYVDAGLWSGSVLIARGDSVLHLEGYGWADAEHRIENSAQTRFPVASVTKTFTAIAAARLWTDGTLEAEAPLSRYLPGFPRASEITIRHLVRHRSGIPDTDDLAWFTRGQRFPHPIGALVDSLARVPLTFDPGTRRDYSNGGYTVLARVLEIATGLPFERVLEEWVFRPAGMTSSGDWSDGGLVPHRAEGYGLAPDGSLMPGPYVHPSNKVGAGSAYTTVGDVFAFFRALQTHALVPAAARDSLFRPIESAFARERLYFGGRGPSYTAAIQIYPADDVLVVALGNNYSRLNEEITDGLAALVLGPAADPRIGRILERRLPFSAVSLTPAELGTYVGDYQHAWGFRFRLELEQERLVYVDPEHGTRTPMIPVARDTFVSPWQWAEIRFGSGDISWRWLDFSGRDWAVERSKE